MTGPDKKTIKSERVKYFFADTAKKMILEQGIESVSVRKTAEMAGYSYATLYNHFKNLDQLLWDTRRLLIKDIAEYLEKNAENDISDSRGIKKIFRTYLEYYITNPNVFRFFYFHKLNEKDKKSGPEGDVDFESYYAKTFASFLDAGTISLEEVGKIMKILIYSVHGMLTLYISGNDNLTVQQMYTDLDEIIDSLL